MSISILCILCILFCIIALSVYTREPFSTDPPTSPSVPVPEPTLDALVYDSVEHDPEKKNRVIKTFQLPLPLETFPRPSLNSTPTVKKELAYLMQLTSSSQAEQKTLAVDVETKGVLPYFINFAGSNSLVYDEEHLQTVSRDVETLSYLLKSYYNRPRPYQLGFVLGYNIIPVTMARTSSYPCEKTLVSKVLAYQLAYNNPKFKEQLHALAKRIELSRYYGGLNFPSDTVAALKVAEILRDRIKYLETTHK